MKNPNGHNKDPMDPQDLRNLFIFFVIAITLYFTYDTFILKPQAKALKAQQKAEYALKKQELINNGGIEIQKAQPLERSEIISSSARLDIESDTLTGSIALKGGQIDDIAFKKYFQTLDKNENVALLSPKNTKSARYIDYGWVSGDKKTTVPDSNTQWRVSGNNKITPEQNVTLFWDSPQGIRFMRTISLDEHYMFNVNQSVVNNSGAPITLYPYGLVAQTGVPEGMQSTWLLHEGPIGYIGDGLEEIKYKTLRKDNHEKFSAEQGWIGITDKYWLTSIIPAQGENVKYSFKYAGLKKDENNQGQYQVDFVGAPITVANGQSGENKSHLFTGAKEVNILNQYRDDLNIPKFDLAVNFGWFWFLSKPFFHALHFLGGLIGNMGVAIIILTILIRGSVFPLTNASYRSFAKMKKVTPQVAEIREKHADDRQVLQQELMKLYQSEGVNPMAGCFPIILQIPIFFALYKVLFVTIEIRHAPFFGWIQDLSAPDPTSVFNLFGLIPWDPPSILMIGIWPCIMLVAMIIQKKLNPPPQDPIQRDMMRFFPFIITFVMSRFASGLVIYWTFSAIIGVIQQMIIMRSLNVPIHLFNKSAAEEKIDDQIDDGKSTHPLAKMAENEIEDALFDGDNDTPPKPIKPPKPKKKKKKK